MNRTNPDFKDALDGCIECDAPDGRHTDDCARDMEEDERWGATVARLHERIESLECNLAIQSETTDKWRRLFDEATATTERVAEQRDRAIAAAEALKHDAINNREREP